MYLSPFCFPSNTQPKCNVKRPRALMYLCLLHQEIKLMWDVHLAGWPFLWSCLQKPQSCVSTQAKNKRIHLFQEVACHFYPSAYGRRGLSSPLHLSICPWDGWVLCPDHFSESICWSFFKFSRNIVQTLNLCLAGLLFFWLIDLWPHMTLKFEHFSKNYSLQGPVCPDHFSESIHGASSYLQGTLP